MNSYYLKNFPFSSQKNVAEMVEEENPQSVLDLGCSDGFLGSILRKKIKRIVGVDIKKIGRSKYYSNIYQTDLNTSKFNFLAGEKFDIIILADILEHLKNPKLILLKCKKFLKRKGTIVISIPNMGFFIVKILRYLNIYPKMENGIFDRTHLHEFTRESFRSLVESLGFEIVEVKSVPPHLIFISKDFYKNPVLFVLYKGLNYMANINQSLFAYQLVFKIVLNYE